MSSPSRDDRPAAWEHGLTPLVLARRRLLIRPLNTPEQHQRLCKASPAKWGDLLARYALFQLLRRREGETADEHRARQRRWIIEREEFEGRGRDPEPDGRRRASGASALRERWTMLPDDPSNSPWLALGTFFASPDELAGSELETLLSCYPTGRALVLDLASDKDRLLAQIAELIDRGREAAGIVAATKRGPKPAKSDPINEHSEFLRTIREHQIVPLRDLQLAGKATGMHATARVLYPELREQRSLLARLKQARKLQDETLAAIPRLRCEV
jgi:hypothetical protein